MFHFLYNGIYKALAKKRLGDELSELLSEPEDTTHLRFAREDEYGLLDTANIQMPDQIPDLEFPEAVTGGNGTTRIKIKNAVLGSLHIPVKVDIQERQSHDCL